MKTSDMLTDAFGRVNEIVHEVVDDLTIEQLGVRLQGSANSISWLVWHLTRVQDDHIAGAAGIDQVWSSQGWSERFALPFDGRSIGFGHTSEQVDALSGVPGPLLLGYHDAVHTQTLRVVSELTDDDLNRVVDTRWNPPVTFGVRLVSVIADDLQHAGQAALIRGLVAPFNG